MVALFLDFRKAFDTMNHSLPLEKLHNCGIKEKDQQLLEIYLSNPYQYTQVNEAVSGMSLLVNGVTKKICSRTIAFSDLLNDINDKLLSKQSINVSDDTALIGDPKQSATRRDIKTCEERLKESKLSLYIDMTTSICSGKEKS